MVRLIMGVKGSGKTKQLIELINNAAKDEPGNVVCIEANRNMTYDIHYHIRLIDAQEYKLNNYDLFLVRWKLRHLPRVHLQPVQDRGPGCGQGDRGLPQLAGSVR